MEHRQRIIAIVELAKSGDEHAFNDLWKRYFGSTIGLIKQWLCSRQVMDSDIVDEIAESTWNSVRQKICNYDPARGTFFTFIRCLAFYALLKYFRDRKYVEVPIGLFVDQTIINGYEWNSMKDEEHLYIRIAEHVTQNLAFPIDDLETLEMYNLLIRITFERGGYPHQLLVFGFNKLLSNWTPKRIVEELSCLRLRCLERKLRDDFASESDLPVEFINSCFQPLANSMDKTLDQVITDQISRNILKHSLFKIVGDTALELYYGKCPEANVSDWTYRVKERVKEEVMRELLK